MDTRSKKSRPFLSWMCMFLALVFLIAAACTARSAISCDAFSSHYSYTFDFANTVNDFVYSLFNLFSADDGDAYYYDDYDEMLTIREARQYRLDDYGCGYYIRIGDEYFSNLGISSASELPAPDEREWGYMLKLENGLYSGYSPSADFPELGIDQLKKIDYDYSPELKSYCIPARIAEQSVYEQSEPVEFVLLLPNAHEEGLLSLFIGEGNGVDSAYQTWLLYKLVLAAWGLILLLGIVFALIAVLRRRDIALFDRRVAQLQSRIVLEIRAAIFIAAVFAAAALISDGVNFSFHIASIAMLALLLFFTVWLTACDLRYTGRQAFAFNIINVIANYLKTRDGMFPPQKRMMRIMRRVLVSGCLLCLTGGFFALVGGSSNEGVLLVFGLVLAYAGVVVLCIGVDRYRSLAVSIGELYSQTQAMRSGELSVPPNKVVNGDLHELADNINCIQDGIKSAVERQLASERMKVELITNVSHDLKTPLTAITNYVGLLDMEQLEPAEANDYVDILAQKASRLTALISDLFEVSKATSGAMELHMEPIDIFSLTEQTLAELEDRISASGVTVKMTYPDDKPWVMADGRRLYRVFENVIGNAIKYSLAGTRIYIDIGRGSELTSVTVRNIANYEMDFDPQEMLERFVRADKSRTAEGSGLGLSIAKSFTELMGGRLNVSADGDVFKVTMVFKSTEPPEQDGENDAENISENSAE